MLNIYLLIAIMIANLAAIGIIYKLITKMEKREKIIFIAISVATVYVIISIIYWMSGFRIDSKIHEAAKDFVIYIFVPINIIIFVPYISTNYIKFKNGKMRKEIFNKRNTFSLIVGIIVLVIEFFYFRNIQQNIKNIQNNIDQNVQTENSYIENIEDNNTIIENEVVSNQID